MQGLGKVVQLAAELKNAEVKIAEYEVMRTEYMLMLNHLIRKYGINGIFTITRGEIQQMMKEQNGAILSTTSNTLDGDWKISLTKEEVEKPKLFLPPGFGSKVEQDGKDGQ